MDIVSPRPWERLSIANGIIQVPRNATSFEDPDDTYQLPPPRRPFLETSDFICKDTQRSWNYSAAAPALKLTAGSNITLQYNENGHITKPQNDPTKHGSGTVFVYGTVQPSSEDTIYGIHRVWNSDNTGGDKRGALIAKTPFDDGKCYQYATDSEITSERQARFGSEVAPGQSLLCNTYVRLPQIVDAAVLIYTIYWVWEWPDIDGSPQLYTSCLDLELENEEQQR